MPSDTKPLSAEERAALRAPHVRLAFRRADLPHDLVECCDDCSHLWPCPTVRLLDERDALAVDAARWRRMEESARDEAAS